MTGTIKSVTQNGIFQGMGKFFVEFNHSQGDSLLFFCKSKPEDKEFPYKTGSTINYTINDKGNGQLIREDNSTSYKPKKNNTSYITMVLSYAKDLVVADVISVDEMYEKADEMFEYVNSKMN